MLPITPRQLMALMLVLVLAASHYGAYSVGRALAEGEHAKERVAELNQTVTQLGEAAKDERKSRARERELTQEVSNVQGQLNDHKKRSAAAANAAADELRQLKEALDARAASGIGAASAGVDGASEGGLLLECARVHQGIAADADTLANKVIGLQEYARIAQEACGKPP